MHRKIQNLQDAVHTSYPIYLYEKLCDCAISLRPSPVKSCCIFANAGEKDVGRVGDFDSKYLDKLGNWLSEDLPGSPHQPVQNAVRLESLFYTALYGPKLLLLLRARRNVPRGGNACNDHGEVAQNEYEDYVEVRRS